MGVKGPGSGVGDVSIEGDGDGVPGSGVGSQPSACGFSTQGSMDGSGSGDGTGSGSGSGCGSNWSSLAVFPLRLLLPRSV